MPLYEYQCPTCGRFELIRKLSDSPVKVCPNCGKGVTKLFSAPAIQFKGAGWYVTDYAKKSSGGDGAKAADSASAAKDGGSKDASPSSTSSSAEKSSPSTPSSTTSSASGSSPSK